jgi:hypothetical protein
MTNIVKRVKAAMLAIVLGVGLIGYQSPARAGIPVIDVASLIQAIMDGLSWIEQLNHMVQQVKQMEDTYDKTKEAFEAGNGLRALSVLTSNKALASLAPSEFSQALKLSGDVGDAVDYLEKTQRIFALTGTMIDPDSSRAERYEASRKLRYTNIAKTRKFYEEGLTNLRERAAKVNEQIGTSVDAKQTADLTAQLAGDNIQATLTTAQAVADLREDFAQQALVSQQAVEVAMQSARGSVPRFTYAE